MGLGSGEAAFAGGRYHHIAHSVVFNIARLGNSGNRSQVVPGGFRQPTHQSSGVVVLVSGLGEAHDFGVFGPPVDKCLLSSGQTVANQHGAPRNGVPLVQGDNTTLLVYQDELVEGVAYVALVNVADSGL